MSFPVSVSHGIPLCEYARLHLLYFWCVCDQGHLCKWVYSYVSARRDTVIMLGIICQVLYTCFAVVCDRFFHLPELHHVGEIWWTVSFKHQPVLALPISALRIQECIFLFYMWVLGIKHSNSGLQRRHVTNWAISPILPMVMSMGIGHF